jgi:hypothetical protein
MNVLVAIANYGPFRYGYLDKALAAYRRMPWQVDVVIHSDRPKAAPAGARVVVGLPTPDPCSLPFAHKALFYEQRDRYDLFVYAEDDILIEADNLTAYVEVSQELGPDEITGFFRYERDDDGRRSFVDAHPPFDWEPGSVVRRGPYTFATFTNEHAGCYALTREQLRRALDSGGYLVPPHETYYDMRASAATDPYTRCGMMRRLCVSHLERFLVHHMPNTYVGFLGTPADEFAAQVARLVAEAPGGASGDGRGPQGRGGRGLAGHGEGDMLARPAPGRRIGLGDGET